MNIDALIKNTPSVDEKNLDAFAEWIYEVKKLQKSIIAQN